MIAFLPYIMMPVMALLLVSAQSLWASVIKNSNALEGSISTIAINLLSNWKMWLGALIYIVATLVYFYMLSKLKFFSVQIAMTAISIIFSVVLSIFVFGEKPNMVNLLGIAVVLVGIIMVLKK